MARGRMITNQISRDKKVDSLSDDTSRLAFTWLITFADNEGRVPGDPAIVRSMVFPRREDVTVEQMRGYITEWNLTGLVVWYEANDDLYIWFPAFEKNQPGLRKDREPDSIIPPPPSGYTQDSNGIRAAVNPAIIRQIDGNHPAECPVKLREENVIKEKGIKEEEEQKPASTSSFSSPAYEYPGELVLQDAFGNVTGMFTFPSSSREEDLRRLRSIYVRLVDKSTLAEYLQPYFAAWISRKYRKGNTSWLDWAITGEIPPEPQERKNGSKQPGTKPPEPAGYAAIRKFEESEQSHVED
jgi:hypothetical protein